MKVPRQRSLVAHFVRDEGVGGSNPLTPTKIRKACSTSRLFASAAHEDENLRGQGGSTRRRPDKTRQRRIRQMCRPLSDAARPPYSTYTTHISLPNLPHISLSINGFVTETIVFFYICLNLFCVTYGWPWHFPLCVLAFMVLIAQISTFSSDFFIKCIKLNHQMFAKY